MPGIYVMTAVTLAVGAVFAVVVLRAIGRPIPLWLLALPLPLSAAVNLLVKRPIYVALAGAAGVDAMGPTSPPWFVVAAWALPPITEEGIKLVFLFLPFVRRQIRDGESALLVGAAVGLGFGLGEALYVGYALGLRSDLASLPWYAFFPFLSERIAAAFIHGALTSIVAVGLWRGRRAAIGGYLTALGLHAAANTGPMLAQLGIVSSDIASLFLIPVAVLVGAIFERQRRAVRPARAERVDEIYVRRV
jgi:RsiW-degrading membrane proteinase PrsW (M82 family)